MKIKLMQITHDLAIGGLQQVVVTICRCINREKFDVSVLCLRDLGPFAKEIEEMGIEVHFLSQPGNGTDYFSFFKVAKILKKKQIDVIHTHNTQPFVDGTLGALLSGREMTIVHTDHARDFPDKRRYMLAEWLMSHFTYKVVGVSAHTSRNLIRYEKISPQKVMTIPNGIDDLKFAIEIDGTKKKQELGLPDCGLIIGLGVRLTRQKGIEYLLKAMPTILEEFPDTAMVIAGEGPLEEELRRDAFSLGIDKSVHFIGPRLDMPELLKLFDLYVLPSLWEGMPMVLLEAMAAGCPVVATDVGGISKVIEHGINGLIVRPRNPEELAEAVIKLLTDEKLRKEFAQNGLMKFRQKFSADIMTRQYEQLYLQQPEMQKV